MIKIKHALGALRAKPGWVFFCLLSICLLLSACGNDAAATPSSTHEPTDTLQAYIQDDLLGTLITVSLYSTDATLAQQCFDLVADIDRRMSANRVDSEISRLNQASGDTAVTLSADTYQLIAEALGYAALSAGAFDISIGAVTDLWKTDGEFNRLPSADELAQRLPLVDYRQVELLEQNQVLLAQAGMMIDLGAIAKGYACDQAVALLQANGVGQALLDFGGNIYALGQKPDGSAYRVGVKSPRLGDNDIACVLQVSDQALVTSGGYERYFEQDGQIYHHILDTTNGMPVDNGLLSVTIVCPSATEADALSTSCFALGLEEGMALLAARPDCEGVFITADYQIHVTDGLRQAVSSTNPNYSLVSKD